MTNIAASGFQNALLIPGTSIEQALQATNKVMVGYGRADPVSLSKKTEDERFWLFVYLGSGSSLPPRYAVTTITADKTTIRFSFAKTQSGIQTADIVPYLYYVPIDTPAKGFYTMELFNETTNRVVLSRTVEVVLP